MVIYLKHPVHGTKIATMDIEAYADEQNGWVRYNPEEPQKIEESENEFPVVVNALQPKRRGRPPKIAA